MQVYLSCPPLRGAKTKSHSILNSPLKNPFQNILIMRNPNKYVHFEYANLSIGQSAELTKNISQKDIENFALFLADNSKDVRAKNVLAQGTYPNYLLLASIISEILGNTLPGPGYVSLGFMFETKSNN